MRCAALLLAALALPLAAAQDDATSKPATGDKAEPAASAPAHDPALFPRVKMETTCGDIVLELNAEAAPISVDNFIQYAKDGYYTGTIFHRCIPGFMIQGGGFNAEMDEKQEGLRDPIKNEWDNGLKNERGTISMARSGKADSATSQFFINVNDNKMLDMPSPRGDNAAYCVFGKVVEGMDVVDGIRDCEKIIHPKYPDPSRQPVTPKEPVVIKSVTVVGDYDRDKVLARCVDSEKHITESRERHEKERAEAMAKREEARRAAEAEEAKQAAPRAAEFKVLLENKKDAEGHELKTTDSGLMYVVLTEGEGSSPEPTDTVSVHYSGWLLDGKEFDSSVRRGRPAEFPLNRVIAGWTEGVGLMKVGSKYRFVIPSDLAYGDNGRPPVIPPKSTLVFDVELLAIK